MAKPVANGTRTSVRQRGGGSCATRAECERRYRAAHPDGKPHSKQLDRLPLMVDWLVRCHRNDGDTFLRSQPQIARAWARAGFDWQPTGQAKRDHQRYESQIKRYLDQLKLIGYVADWEPVYKPNGEGIGVRITVSADVAQLAVATRKRRRRGRGDFSSAPPRRRASISGTLRPPSGGTTAFGCSTGRTEVQLEKLRNVECGCARASIDERDAAVRRQVGHHESPGAAVAAEARPQPGAVIAAMLVAWRRRTTARPNTDLERWRPVAEHAVARLERTDTPERRYWGSGIEIAVELVGAHPAERWPRSLAYFIRKLDSISKHHRHAARHAAGACGPLCRGSKGAKARAAAYKAAHPELWQSVGDRLWEAQQ